MTYAYNTRGLPAVGNGLPGLPVRNGADIKQDDVLLFTVSPAAKTQSITRKIEVPAGYRYMRIFAVGAGGNGGNGSATSNTNSKGSGGGGGGGGIAISEFIPIDGSPVEVNCTVTSSSSTASALGRTISANSGGNGTSGSYSTPSAGAGGAGGTASGGLYNYTGGVGKAGATTSSAVLASGGGGGSVGGSSISGALGEGIVGLALTLKSDDGSDGASPTNRNNVSLAPILKSQIIPTDTTLVIDGISCGGGGRGGNARTSAPYAISGGVGGAGAIFIELWKTEDQPDDYFAN